MTVLYETDPAKEYRFISGDPSLFFIDGDGCNHRAMTKLYKMDCWSYETPREERQKPAWGDILEVERVGVEQARTIDEDDVRITSQNGSLVAESHDQHPLG